MSSLADTILHVPPALALLLVFAVPALEASAFVGFVFPGEVAALLGGVLAFEGRVSLVAACAAAIAGAVVGDSVGYAVGRRWGGRLLARIPERLLKPDHVRRASGAVNRLGGRAVVVGRFTAALRVLVPGMCGIARMPYGRFLLWNAVGGTVWAGGSVLLGFAAGRSWRTLHERFSQASLVALGVVVVAVVVALLVRRRRRGADRATKQPASVAAAGDDDRR